MKPIRIPYYMKFDMDIAIPKSEGKLKVTYELSNNEDYFKIRKRAGSILMSCFEFERHLTDILTELLFKENKNDYNFLVDTFIDSDFLMFDKKIKILNKVLKEKNIIKGKERSSLEFIMPKIRDYRNSFAHGEISSDFIEGRHNFYLKYSRVGESIKTPLDEEYWDNLIAVLDKGYALLNKIDDVIYK